MEDSVFQAEKAIAEGKRQLIEAVKQVFTLGRKVFVKGPRGEKETKVVSVEGEDVFVETSKGTMKRHYSTLRRE